MGNIRKIRKILKSMPTVEGAGVHLKRAFGFNHVPELDPFLLLDDFHSNDPKKYIMGFPWHPHKGIETITYVLQGNVEHGDSMGNKGATGPGDVQWMTAGSGIIHQEMPKGDADKNLWGFQLWANLPASHKMMDPRYQEVKSDQIPEITRDNGIRIKIICGSIDGVQGPVTDIVTDPEYFDIEVPADTSFEYPTKPGYTVLAYVIEGEGCFDPGNDQYSYEIDGAKYFDLESGSGPDIGKENLIMFDDGDSIVVRAGKDGVRFLLMTGKPIGEPVAWYGPVVMNTQEELQQAFEDYRNGTFVK
ncbi:pirin family protein [Methanolobus sp. WCC4]|uniref:pirin family protein n=1 Tax=Methanolobus sp. WCC4 TaxID=3125784 RepID=UPI0030F61ACA